MFSGDCDERREPTHWDDDARWLLPFVFAHVPPQGQQGGFVANNQRVEGEIAGKKVIFEAGWMAKQASGCVTVRIGDTISMAAVVAGAPRGLAFEMVPLTVDYRERMAAAGKFPGGFMKREGRPSTEETLSAREVDRPIRPLIPEGLDNDIVISCLVLSADGQNDPALCAANAASAALLTSDIPFNGPVSSIRVGLIGTEFVFNPTTDELKESALDLLICGTKDGIIMVEAGAKEVGEEQMLGAFTFAEPLLKQVNEMQLRLQQLIGKAKKEYDVLKVSPELAKRLAEKYEAELRRVFFSPGKTARAEAIEQVVDKAIEEFSPSDEQGQTKPGYPTPSEVKAAWEIMHTRVVREYILEGRRADGRRMNEIRPIDIQIGLLPRVHGSALFTRGETQALCTTTLGTGDDEQIVDGLREEYSKRFYLHYNFPSFSVGETKPNRGPGRREIGHGDLAERALEPVMPEKEAFPYTVRIISDILESNGSSSMATVCGGSLSMMDAGVPVRAAVAGVAMGLVREGQRYAIVSDILGSEDAYGDMDFKVAGTEKGITALQMDLKAGGIPLEIVREALEEAHTGRLFVLGKMREAIAQPRADLSPYAPRIVKIMIDPEKIGLVIGPGGKMIRDIEARSGATVEIEDDGSVLIASSNKEALDSARSIIENLVEELKVGKIYRAKVVSLKDFGAFCEIEGKGQDGLVHASEITENYVERVSDYLQIGLEVEVKLINIDPQGRNRFSIKQARRDRGMPPLGPLGGGDGGGGGASAGGPGATGAGGAPGGRGPVPGGRGPNDGGGDAPAGVGGGEQRFRESRPRPGGGPPGGGRRDRGGRDRER
ncbi:MAG: polyribonucleotide nucleotidyltransferase [Planctomycetes bacterium]|nr:polyribonucleotide nucleotidyltransferase [Planctomycetota bacterium]